MAFIVPALPYIVAGAAVLSTGLAIDQGNQAKKEAEARAALERSNAEFAAKQSERMKYLRLGQVRAAHGGAGGVFEEGSVLDVLADVAAQSDLERQQILAGGAARSSIYQQQGSSAQTAGYLTAGSELLGGTVNTVEAFERVG